MAMRLSARHAARPQRTGPVTTAVAKGLAWVLVPHDDRIPSAIQHVLWFVRRGGPVMTGSATKAECDHCGLKVRIREDGTVAPHHYTRNRLKVECEHSGRRYAFHMGTFRVVARYTDGKAALWLVECRCGEAQTGPTYDVVEAWHAEHVTAAYAPSEPAPDHPKGQTHA
jgi:hypothetical protein